MSSSDPDPLVGQVLLGKLEVVRQLGAGGMGAVYEVVHLITKHHRALKVLHADFAAEPDVVARLLREASVAGTLNSPHVVETYDAGQLEDGSPYVLMEMLRGETLGDRFAGGRMAPGHVVRWVHAAAQGLEVAHAAGIVHRDVKPENLFITEDEGDGERLKVLDFGISKFDRADDPDAVRLTQTGRVMGTPLYMSPEQANGQRDLDARADVYALGVILYEGLAGRPPFVGETLPALIIRIHTGDCPSLETVAPHVIPGLREVVERAMNRERDARYPDAAALVEALEPFVGEQPFDDTMASMPAPMRIAVESAPTLARTDSDEARAMVESAPTLARPPGTVPEVEAPEVEPARPPGTVPDVEGPELRAPEVDPVHPTPRYEMAPSSRAPVYLGLGVLAVVGVGALGYYVASPDEPTPVAAPDDDRRIEVVEPGPPRGADPPPVDVSSPAAGPQPAIPEPTIPEPTIPEPAPPAPAVDEPAPDPSAAPSESARRRRRATPPTPPTPPSDSPELPNVDRSSPYE